jgi:chemotaxis protein methyltransferase WspC
MITTLLSETIGLNPDVIGSQRIARAVETRQVACNLPDIKSYGTRLQTSLEELEELIELLVVPETWFFRDSKPFDYLKTYVTTEWLLKPSLKPLQVLSIPCSTGEEPYSLAMALLQAGLLPKQFTVTGIDISHRAIRKAKKGIYTKNSFRGDSWNYCSAYFQEKEGGYEISQSIRSLVNFQQGNILTALEQQQKQYHIIFCRNLLIYLQSSACSQILSAIDRLLLPGGLLFVGASETVKITAPNYQSVRQPFTFAYRKLELSPPPPLLKAPITPQTPQVLAKPKLLTPQTLNPQKNPPLSLPLGTKNDLARVRKLGDEGRSTEAIKLCNEYLADNPTSDEAYLLLGELYQAQGELNQAEQCFQRAIYLNPNLEKALVHLALLKESKGDLVSANLIQHRLKRLQASLTKESQGGN